MQNIRIHTIDPATILAEKQRLKHLEQGFDLARWPMVYYLETKMKLNQIDRTTVDLFACECPFCFKSFDFFMYLCEHLETLHKDLTDLQLECPFPGCRLPHRSAPELAKHLRKGHTGFFTSIFVQVMKSKRQTYFENPISLETVDPIDWDCESNQEQDPLADMDNVELFDDLFFAESISSSDEVIDSDTLPKIQTEICTQTDETHMEEPIEISEGSNGVDPAASLQQNLDEIVHLSVMADCDMEVSIDSNEETNIRDVDLPNPSHEYEPDVPTYNLISELKPNRTTESQQSVKLKNSVNRNHDTKTPIRHGSTPIMTVTTPVTSPSTTQTDSTQLGLGFEGFQPSSPTTQDQTISITSEIESKPQPRIETQIAPIKDETANPIETASEEATPIEAELGPVEVPPQKKLGAKKPSAPVIPRKTTRTRKKKKPFDNSVPKKKNKLGIKAKRRTTELPSAKTTKVLTTTRPNPFLRNNINQPLWGPPFHFHFFPTPPHFVQPYNMMRPISTHQQIPFQPNPMPMFPPSQPLTTLNTSMPPPPELQPPPPGFPYLSQQLSWNRINFGGIQPFF